MYRRVTMPARVECEAWERLKVGDVLLVARIAHLMKRIDNLIAGVN